MIHYLYRVIVFEFRLCSMEYFLDEMQQYEINTLIENIKYVDRTQREMSRYQLYVTVQANSKKKLKPEELIKLPWDEDNVFEKGELTTKEIEQHNEDMKRIEEKFAQMTKKQNN